MRWDINFLRFLATRVPVSLYDSFFIREGFRQYRQNDLKREFSAFECRVRAGEVPRQISLYVHVPFCAKLCTFCHCARSQLFNTQEVTEYIGQVDRHLLHMFSWLGHPTVASVYFGGGSPSLLSEAGLEKFFHLIFGRILLDKNASIDFEAHPAQFSLAKAKILHSFGVKRLSLGVQSLDPIVLKAINRSQSLRQVESAVSAVRKSGIPTLNTDIVAGLPQQTVGSFLNDVRTMIRMGVDIIHITPFSDIRSTVYGQKVGIEELLSICRKRDIMIKEGKGLVEQAGYRRYAFEAYAKSEENGCRHEYNYLYHAASVLGVGPYARGILSGHLQYYTLPRKKMNRWIFIAGRTDKRYAMARFLILHMLRGISGQEFRNVFAEDMEVFFYEELSFLLRCGIIMRDGTKICYRGDRSMKSLFEYFALSRVFYGEVVLKQLRKSLQRHYNTSYQYSFEKDGIIPMMEDHWFLQLYYDVGL